MKLPKLKFASSNEPRVDDDPLLRPLAERLSDLKVQRTGLAKRIAELQGSSADGVSAQAAALVGGGDLAEIDLRSERRGQLEVARSHLAIVTAAIPMAERAVEVEHKAAIDRYLDSVKEEYTALSNQAAQALIALGHVQEASEAFQAKLRAAGAGDWPVGYRGPVGIGRVGTPIEQDSLFGAWLIAAARAGAIDMNDIPKAWRESWGVLRDLAQHSKDSTNGNSARIKVSRMAHEASAPTARARAADRNARRAGSRG